MNNIRCEVIRDLLPLYVDEVVSDITREEIQKHLRECSECQHIYELHMKDLKLPILKEDIRKEKEEFRFVQKKLRKEKISRFLAMLAVFAGIMLAVYILGIHGLAASSEDISYKLFFSETDNRSSLTVNFTDVNEKLIVMKVDVNRENNVHKIILREAPLFDVGGYTCGYGVTMDQEQIEDSSADVTILIVFKDRTDTLSWKELYNDPDINP